MIRSLPHFKGKFRLIRLLYRQKIKSGRNITVNGKYNLQYLLPNIHESIGFQVFADGIYEPETSALICSRIKQGDTLIDIGANIGSVIMPVCRQVPDIKAVCVEASPHVFAYLQKNIQVNNFNNCQLINKAVADGDGKEYDFFSPEEMYGKGALAAEPGVSTVKIKSVSIDSLLSALSIEKIALIKIDIEGYEYFAFKGAELLLSGPDAPDIVFEFLDLAEGNIKDIQPGDAQQFLLNCGYKIYRVRKKGKLEFLQSPMKNGESMLLATKRGNA